MFWKRKETAPRRPGITGTGRFIRNLEWTLWDDTHSPGLIGDTNLEELETIVLTKEERTKLALHRVRDVVARKPKHTVAEENDAAAIYQKLNAYLVDVREAKFEELGRWLDSNLMRDKDGRVVRADGSRAANVMSSPVKAYLNCLEIWGFGYQWEEVADSRDDPALLIRREHRKPHVLLESELKYVQGKPYRFEIYLGHSRWCFEDRTGHFEITMRGKDEAERF